MITIMNKLNYELDPKPNSEKLKSFVLLTKDFSFFMEHDKSCVL